MHRTLLLLAALTISGSALAEASCALRVARLFASSQSASLTTWFSSPASNLGEQLSALASHVGKVSEVSEASQNFEGLTIRRSVVPASQPSDYSFRGTWASARSEHLGAIRIQASAEPGQGCKLLALHIDTRRN